MIKKIIVAISAIVLLSFTSLNNFRELVLKKLISYTDNFPEKVYIQTDKPYYSLGEDIWFTVYLVNGITHKRTDKSRIVYVELINEQDVIIDKRQLYTNDISVSGDFKLNKDLVPGNYLIRGYTNYMRNQNSEFLFQKKLSILDVTKPLEIKELLPDSTQTTLKTDSFLNTKPNIKFYPEGGNLVNGLFCKVAIEVKDINNRKIDIQGTIKDSNDNILQYFKTEKFGLAVATLTPESDKNYYASVIIDEKKYKYPLPKALPQGFNITAVRLRDQISVKVSSNMPTRLLNTYLVGHLRGDLIFEKLETTDTDTYIVKLSTKELSEGVANFTLFNSNGKPVCERLVFIDNPNDNIKVNLNINNESPTTREKISMQLDLNDFEGNPLTGNLSVAITDIDIVDQSTKSENIKTYLLLNSDLRGSIEDPGYFFEDYDDPKRRYLLDLIMLTKGWRRFTWTDLLYENSNSQMPFNPETGIYISGSTRALKGDRQSISAATRITLMGKLPYQDKMQSDQTGRFKYGPYIFNDSIPALIEARISDFKNDDDEKNRFVSIFLNEPKNNSPTVEKYDILKSHLNDSTKLNNFINQSIKRAEIDSVYLEKATLLDEVLITTRKRAEEDERRNQLNERTLHGVPSNRIDMADFENQRYLSIIELLNRLPGVVAFNETITIRNQGPPKILIDGITVEIQDILYLTGIDIDFIDVLKGIDANMYSNSANGVIAIYTRTGDFDKNINIKRQPGIIDFKAIGFYTAREFYAPDHINDFDGQSKPDIRTTLHWEPKITLTQESKMAEISFFTSDSKSNYGIRIEGITDSGIPFYHLSTLEVD